jgi:release factor glutamine methyltransferase
VGVDTSGEALGWAARNVAAHELDDRATLIETGWLEQASPGFDVVLCNPPYIASADIDALAPDVRLYEPHSALDGGPDGLDAYRALSPRIGGLLAPAGRAFVEVGAGQAGVVRQILEAGHLKVVSKVHDLAGIMRCIVLKRDNQDG